MMSPQSANNCRLVDQGRVNSPGRGWVYASNGQFRSDRASEPLILKDDLRALAGAGAELTYTGVPQGAGPRMGIDRDEDSFFDRTEMDAGSDPADPSSTPATVAVGPLGDTGRTMSFTSYPNPVRRDGAVVSFELPARDGVRLQVFDAGGRLVRTLLTAPAGPGLVRVRWNGADERGRRVA